MKPPEYPIDGRDLIIPKHLGEMSGSAADYIEARRDFQTPYEVLATDEQAKTLQELTQFVIDYGNVHDYSHPDGSKTPGFIKWWSGKDAVYGAYYDVLPNQLLVQVRPNEHAERKVELSFTPEAVRSGGKLIQREPQTGLYPLRLRHFEESTPPVDVHTQDDNEIGLAQSFTQNLVNNILPELEEFLYKNTPVSRRERAGRAVGRVIRRKEKS